MNYVLYRCEDEEKEYGIGGTYDIPGHGKLFYAGLQGESIISLRINI